MKIKDILPWMKEFRRLLWLPLDLLYPPRCPLCDEPLPPGSLICPECLPKISFVKAPYCYQCGKPMQEGEKEYCRDCSMHPHFYKKGRALSQYRGMEQSLYRFKYAGRKEYARFYAAEIKKRMSGEISQWGGEVLVPIPIHPKRKQKRGYNQALELAKELGKQLGMPVEQELLVRVKNTRPQKELDPSKRQNNLKNAFKINVNDVKWKSIILVDDIYTTGSTMDACARLLQAAGVENIYCITVAIGNEKVGMEEVI